MPLWTCRKPTDTKSEFKPRKIKKSIVDYRDRAAERRLGKAGDFAEVLLDLMPYHYLEDGTENTSRARLKLS